MPETLAVNDAVELAVVVRSGFVESRHIGAAIVLAADGEVAATYGNADALLLPRSSMKPFQAVASLAAGAELFGEALAISTASHSGTDRHVQVVQNMLASVGLNADDLECPAAWPTDSATRDAMSGRLEAKSRLRMNCSGKHAAMLIGSLAAGWPTRGYSHVDHPMQQHTREVIERFIGEKIAHTAIDGCGAPVYAMTLAGLARGIHRIASSSIRSPFALYRQAAGLFAAVREHPWTIAGPNQPDTIAIDELGVFSKFGAEGVQVMSAPDGTTVALKMLDGSTRAGVITALALLTKAGAVTREQFDAVDRRLTSLAVLGGGIPVGRIRPVVG